MRKKSIKKSVAIFSKAMTDLKVFIEAARKAKLSDLQISYCHDYGIIFIYREFENLILTSLVGSINKDIPNTIAQNKEVNFPNHMAYGVCEYIVVGDGYFNFRGRDDLIKKLKSYLPNNHWLVEIVKDGKYKKDLDKLTALRNYAAHQNSISKKRALQVVGQGKIGSAGSWLKSQNRFSSMLTKFAQLASEIERKSPF